MEKNGGYQERPLKRNKMFSAAFFSVNRIPCLMLSLFSSAIICWDIRVCGCVCLCGPMIDSASDMTLH